MPNIDECTICIIGLGYVGLPLAISFSEQTANLKRNVIGYDVNQARILELANNQDITGEVEFKELYDTNKNIKYTCDKSDLTGGDVFIITVPTPIDDTCAPNLNPLCSACEDVGKALGKILRDKSSNIPIIIFESTVFPGATEEVCIPLLEKYSGKSLNEDFYVGYSPERINPGDKSKRLKDIVKVTSGSTKESANWIDKFYNSVITAGTYKAESIKVAEAAKVIENIQRDVNIALVNELSIMFKYMDLDTLDVLNAASTKWNFQKYVPGLVGGHCIGVDPYYLTYKASKVGYSSKIVLSGRQFNDNMSKWISEKIIVELTRLGLCAKKMNLLYMGLSFKENCPDLRNSKSCELLNLLKPFFLSSSVVVPIVNLQDAEKIVECEVTKTIPSKKIYQCIVIATPHKEFDLIEEEFWTEQCMNNCFIADLKGRTVPRALANFRL